MLNPAAKSDTGDSFRSSFGIVVLLDALGAATATSEAAGGFLRAFNNILGFLEKTKPVIAPLINYRMKIFGDSILIIVETRKPSFPEDEGYSLRNETNLKLAHQFENVCALANNIVVKGIENRILFRGAIAIGEFMEDATSTDLSTILGPAVSDAAAWYERPDFIGVIATTRTSFYIDILSKASQEADSLSGRGNYILWDDAPLKGESRPVHVLDWTSAIPNAESVGENIGDWFTYHMAEYQMPLAADSKYLNTRAFFKYASESRS